MLSVSLTPKVSLFQDFYPQHKPSQDILTKYYKGRYSCPHDGPPAAKSDDVARPRCRCLPSDPCWKRVPWASLNASVHGRLEVSVDEMAPCMKAIGSAECSAALEGSDDEFWLTSRPNGFQHTGLFGVWNISDRLSSYSVRAETEADFQATIAFAAAHNLRLVVKATGHDWYGRSTAAGSLLLWTHLRKEINWHESFVPAGSAEKGVPAVTVDSGVQFSDLVSTKVCTLRRSGSPW